MRASYLATFLIAAGGGHLPATVESAVHKFEVFVHQIIIFMEVNSFIFSPPASTAADWEKVAEYLVWVPVYCSSRRH